LSNQFFILRMQVTLPLADLVRAFNITFISPNTYGNTLMDRMSNPAAVRYIVNDVDAAIQFYTRMLNFKVEMHPAPEFAILSRENLRLMLSKPSGKGGGGQPMTDGTTQTPGGWNRFEIEVEDLPSTVEKLKKAGCTFRNEIVTGVGGMQILLKDPSGNLVELFQFFKDSKR